MYVKIYGVLVFGEKIMGEKFNCEVFWILGVENLCLFVIPIVNVRIFERKCFFLYSSSFNPLKMGLSIDDVG